jgi:hypothetical protein
MHSLHPEDRKWFNNMIRKGYFIKINSRAPFEYRLTCKAKEFIATISNYEIEIKNLKISKDTEDLNRLWQKLKFH